MAEIPSYFTFIAFNTVEPVLSGHSQGIGKVSGSVIQVAQNTLLKLINNSSRENKENHYCDRGLDMCSLLQ